MRNGTCDVFDYEVAAGIFEDDEKREKIAALKNNPKRWVLRVVMVSARSEPTDFFSPACCHRRRGVNRILCREIRSAPVRQSSDNSARPDAVP